MISTNLQYTMTSLKSTKLDFIYIPSKQQEWYIHNKKWTSYYNSHTISQKDRSERERRHVIHKPNKEKYKALIGHGGSIIDKKVLQNEHVGDVLLKIFWNFWNWKQFDFFKNI